MGDAARQESEPVLLARVVVIGPDGTVAVRRLESDRPPDLAAVEEVARLALAARRCHGWVRLEDVRPILVRLLELTGLLEHIDPTFDDLSDESSGGGTSYMETGGASMPTATPTIQVSRVHAVGIPVTDQDRAVRFYVLTLGFELQRDVPIGAGKRWIEVAPPQGRTTVALVPSGEGLPVGVQTGIRLVSSDVAGAHAALRSQGVDVDDILRWEGVPPMFAFRDPDRNGLELVEEA